MWDEYLNHYIYIGTGTHVHVLIKFVDGATLPAIAAIVGISPQYIEVPRAGGYAYDDMLSYLCHIKYPKKFSYDPKDIVTIIGKSYLDYYDENRERWIRSRYKRIIRDANVLLNEIRVRIYEGELSRESIILDDGYREVYYYHRDKIERWLNDKKIIDGLVTQYKPAGNP